ncbi:ParA family protein [Borrelia sp. RT1S]|uniref:ParA family protein n=1 Tax=Borrelia sp. RT1S TaxID=2898580 RepID=UPI001E56CD31|nr:AAA family ATPase [Borrelia sp. RT1S]UGQ17927.1 AAA family ATPase [Borrelia sp. RT1S]
MPEEVEAQLDGAAEAAQEGNEVAAQAEVIDQEILDERTRKDSTRVGGVAGVPLEVPEAPDGLNPDELEEDEELCSEAELDIVFFTDEGQLFDLTPYTDITSVTLEQRIVDPTLKTASSVFKFAAGGLSNEFLNFLFFRQDDIFVVVKEGSSPLFAGILEKFFTREVLETTASISFTVNDYSKLLRISFENPVQFPVNFAPDWLYVYNPYIQDQSIVHMILAKTKLANSVDNEASEAILERVPAVIIDSGEDVETILSALLYEFGYAYTFTGAGKLVILPIWRSEVVKREVQLCSIDAASYVCSKSSASSYDSNRIIWREGQFQAKSEAIAKKRPLYSAPINVAGAGGGMYVGVLQKGVVYPDFADKAGSAVYQEYDPTWFDTAYKWDFTRHEVWHDKYALNENLAIISTHNLEARFSADSSIKLVHEEYYPTKAKLWFVNESQSQGSKYIYYFDIYGDVFYTTVRNIMQTDNADDFYAKRAEYATRFIFDPDSAVRLFDFLTNLRVKGHTIVNFKSKQELQLTDFVRLKLEDEELEHFFLILSKKYVRFDMQTRFFEYEGLTWGDYSHYDYLTTSNVARHSVYKVLSGKMTIDDSIVNVAPNIDIIPSYYTLQHFVKDTIDRIIYNYEHGPRSKMSYEDITLCLRKAMLFLTKGYDYILIDTPPTLDLILENVLFVSDYVIVPLICELWTIESFSLIKHKVNTELNLNIPTYTMVTRYTKRSTYGYLYNELGKISNLLGFVSQRESLNRSIFFKVDFDIQSDYFGEAVLDNFFKMLHAS